MWKSWDEVELNLPKLFAVTWNHSTGVVVFFDVCCACFSSPRFRENGGGARVEAFYLIKESNADVTPIYRGVCWQCGV